MIYNSRYINYLILYYTIIKKTYMTYKPVDSVDIRACSHTNTHTHKHTHTHTHIYLFIYLSIYFNFSNVFIFF